ncbi:hypothetical protein [Lactococcus lactis]|jgi:hypothetical protein|uniref:hypothetical protein n=1 Tax=Lactococcus lactis TaxID=1358 RepID=UPI0021A89552|nr:hypothetical protein [Lactococcus lactis]
MKVIIKWFAFFLVIVSIFLLFFQIKVNRELKAKNTTLSIEKEVLKTNNDTYEYLNSLTVESFEKKYPIKMTFWFILEIVNVLIVHFSQRL